MRFFLESVWRCIYYPVRIAKFILASVTLVIFFAIVTSYSRFHYEKESIFNFAIAWPFNQTKWSETYRQDAFRSIGSGFNREKVIAAIGEPLEKQIYSNGEIWHYSCAKVTGECRYFSKPYHRRDVSFDRDGWVKNIWYEYWID